MKPVPFPLPVTLFGRELIETCHRALEEAWRILGDERENLVVGPEVARTTLATGIVLAATYGARDPRRLTKAALDHLDHAMLRCVPALEPIPGEAAREGKTARRYRDRAEELRAFADGAISAQARASLGAISIDYERMANSVERIEISRKGIAAAPLAPRLTTIGARS